ncbi:Twitching mobility protein [Planctomycetes bacterium Poly30]|uniref:Twitching mobility protein n=1 Tax=Saltatorellus ferox TaxID=2528018 RepID=A0A518EWA8_9BACT|nr:Twitching mobility protein [Planctomycetes bacterium Poly30]
MQDQPQDEFSFKGVAPDDRQDEAGSESLADQAASQASPSAHQHAMPHPAAPLPAGPLPGAPANQAPPEKVVHVDLASVMAVVGEAAASMAQELPAPVAAMPAASTSSAMAYSAPSSGPDLPATSGIPDAPALEGAEAPASVGTSSEGSASPEVKRARVTLEVQGDDPSLGKTVNPRHLVQGWLAEMVKSKASDLILRSGGRPSKRQDGKISFLPGRVPGPGPMMEVLRGILGEKRMEQFEETGAADAALDLDGLGRFRINAYKQMGEPAIVIRRINENAPSLDELHLPSDALKDLALRKRGLVLVTGVAGSGKSTTLSAMIEFMNRNVERHIVTLEDPVELMFKERYCVISQREVGTDTTSFKQGIKHALRQSPDVIFIGEMRDAETVLAALEAIETGHLVMSTMHTVNAAQTVDRILGFFPAERHVQIRQRMADTLAGVLSMRLVPRIGGGQVPAFELMQVTPQVRELLEEGKTTELGRVIQGGMEKGIVSFNDRLFELVQTGFVDIEDAVQSSDRPDELIMMVRGIQGGQRAAAKAQKQGQIDSVDSTGTPMRRRTDMEETQSTQEGGSPSQGASGGSNLRLRGNSDY